MEQDLASQELAAITGQKPVITRARKSIANFKLRKAMPIGSTLASGRCSAAGRGKDRYPSFRNTAPKS
jgi:hypothetical protein